MFVVSVVHKQCIFQDFCEDEWRRSRLEIDCSKGDGLNFIAPKGSMCNPFSSTNEGML